MNAPTALPPAVDLPAGTVAVLPMRNLVLFPQVLTPVTLGRPKSVAAFEHAIAHELPVVLVLQREPGHDDPALADLWPVGTLTTLGQHHRHADGQVQVVCQGLHRVRLLEPVVGLPFLAARIEPMPDAAPSSSRAEALALQLRERVQELLSAMPGVPGELVLMLQTIREPAQLADLAASLIDIEPQDKQQLLEILPTEERLEQVLQRVTHRLEVMRIAREIAARTQERFDDRQRRVLLHEQLRAIQKELGENGDEARDIDQLDEAITAAQMPPAVESQVRKEWRRLKRMADAGSEAAPLRTWIEWMTELPWAPPAELRIDLAAARQSLEADHFGLARAKQRIVEYLAVKKLNPQGRAPILCLVGPPGVGKTSLGQSVARALDRPFVRVSLGGVHDEAELRGHRRTYVGAMPGHIVQALRKAGARDAVLMLDEIDKMSAGLHGDPYAALLELLDPEQNASFRDNYLGQPFDVSRVLFIATANVVDGLPAAVRDRLELIELPGYTLEEKLAIAHRHLLARQMQACGLRDEQCQVSEAALRAIATDYTREAGVRQYERELGRVLRAVALQLAEGQAERVRVDASDLATLLGPPTVEHDIGLRTSLTGVATGLAWTPVGGDILFIEATRMAGTGRLILTGQLGEVMKESAQAALTLVKSHAAALGLSPAAFEQLDVHVHVPAGAIPKDGPSAGVALFVALASLFSERPVRHDLAMSGEISLRGLVLPVGGIKDKVLAAQRAGLRGVLLPARNRKDLQDIPEPTREALNFTWLDSVDDAIEAALVPRLALAMDPSAAPPALGRL
ncbi:MAG: endopeptidase La [Inhella sp.]|uniref:endopeptidase La n=1 Tax=Inhella sp. TaxID=1921806 RepID=UPI0022BF10DA|nr:endopeptidase La [Inhella sp.]MCZ8234312.1 endopeptidase La [Inhella sp.]